MSDLFSFQVQIKSLYVQPIISSHTFHLLVKYFIFWWLVEQGGGR